MRGSQRIRQSEQFRVQNVFFRLESPADRRTHERCVKSVLDFIILSALEEEPMCGYDIIGYIQDRYHVMLSPGSVYPMLRSMEKDKFIDHTPTDRKKVFRLTITGREAVRLLFNRYKRILAISRPDEFQRPSHHAFGESTQAQINY